MRKADLFDEIIFCLREHARREPTAEISPELLTALMTELPAQKSVPLYESVRPARPSVSVPPPPAQTTGTATESCTWDELAARVKTCRNCPLCETRTNTVFGDGNPEADLMFIGEGPGENEDLQGLPFVGKAGELLTRMIAAMGFDRWKDAYIANVVKCRPPGNRNPEDSEAFPCLPYLNRQIELIKPKVIVLLGAVPLLYLLNKRGITRLHGQWFEYKGIRTLPTFHPAYLLRNPAMKADAWKDLQTVMREFGRVPGRAS